MIQNARNNSALSSYDKMKPNADGSIDLYFGTRASAGQESNWIKTVSGKGFNPMMRFYTRRKGCSTGRGSGDIELMK